MIIDAECLSLGRIATKVAKTALLGEEVIVVNCENSLVKNFASFSKKYTKLTFEIGRPNKGPFIHRRPDFFVRRIIRGMLPYKTSRGVEAYKRIKCYIGFPEDIKGDVEKVEAAETENVSKYATIEKVCLRLGGKA